jgi:preprotein translocase subunit SecG
VLAALFFSTSILLAITAGGAEKDRDIIQDLTGESVADPNAPISTDDLLNTLGSGAAESAPAVPSPDAAPAPATETPPADAGDQSAPEPQQP